jgi:hypothetical protein
MSRALEALHIKSVFGGTSCATGDTAQKVRWGRVRLTASSAQEHEGVDESVPDENRITHNQPPMLGHHAGVDERSDVVLDKSAFIASLPCKVSKPVL